MTSEEQLLDYRRMVAAMYASVRTADTDPAHTCQTFRRERDTLFRTHSQSALSSAQKIDFEKLAYYEYVPDLRFEVPVEPIVDTTPIEITLPDDGVFRMRRFGRLHLRIREQDVSLTAYWIMGYGGGLFLPFGDLSGRDETYGGGRYLLDTIKGADLGQHDTRLVIDFNYAYNPSCAYNERWVCPLTPPKTAFRLRFAPEKCGSRKTYEKPGHTRMRPICAK